MIFSYAFSALTDFRYNDGLALIQQRSQGKQEMAESPMVGARVPVEWQQKIQGIAEASGRKEAEVVREAIAQYLGETDPSTVKGAIEDLQERVANLERKLGRLAG